MAAERTPCQVIPDLWDGATPQDRAEATRHCRRCPALVPCRNEVRHEQGRVSGIVAGLSERSRRRLRKGTGDPWGARQN